MNEKEALKILAAKDKHPAEVVKEAAQIVLQHRRLRDPLWQFKPTMTQEAFLASRVRYKLLSSANRGGKTSCIAVKLARCAMRRDPVWTVPKEVNGIYCVFAPRRDQIVDPWFKKLCEGSELKGGPWENEPMIPKREIKKVYYTHGGGKPMPKVIELNNGHRIWFGVSGDKHAWEGLEGKGMVLGIALDESAGTQNLIDECMVRLLDAHSHPAVKAACGGGWLDWGATETKLNDAFTNFRAKCEDDSFADYASFWIKPDENPAIDPEERAKYAQVLSEDAYRARMEGEGGAHEALLVYPQFDEDVHWNPEPYVVQDTDTIYVGYDPGSNVSGLVFCAYRQDDPRVCHVFAARELKRATIAAEAECIRRTVLGRRIEWVAYDQAARKVEKSSGSTVLWQLMSELKKRGMTPKSGFFKGRSNYGDSVPVVRVGLNDRRIVLHKGAEILRAQFKTHRFTEKGGELKEDNIQKGNDHCFVAGTQVLTDTGNRPIETLKVGDLVWTRNGLRPIVQIMVTADQPVGIVRGNGWMLEGTGNHPVWAGDDFKRLDSLGYADSISLCPNALLLPLIPSHSTASLSVDTQKASVDQTLCISHQTDYTVSVELADTTKSFGSITTAPSLTDTTFTIRTGIRLTTPSKTWSAWTRISTLANTLRHGMRSMGIKCRRTLSQFAHRLPFGMGLRKARRGIASMLARSLMSACVFALYVKYAARSLMTGRTGPDFAATTASQRSAGAARKTTSSEPVLSVESPSQPTSTYGLRLVAGSVEQLFAPSGTKTVYNISVGGEPEYFANGVLVHNCIDSFRYLYSTAPYWKQRDPNPARMRDDGLEISYSQDKSTMTDEEWNVQEQMRASKLYAMGKLPGWD